MYNEVIKLIKESKTVNEFGDTVVTKTEREVFAGLRSIGQAEFYQAQAVGLRPEIKFVMADYLDYEDEMIVKYQKFGGTEEEYSVIRTFRNKNEMELICRKGID